MYFFVVLLALIQCSLYSSFLYALLYFSKIACYVSRGMLDITCPFTHFVKVHFCSKGYVRNMVNTVNLLKINLNAAGLYDYA